jgi:hypothetical protein
MSEKRLNENHQRHLRVTCEYMDKLLEEAESILRADASGSPFPRYITQISPENRRVIEEYIADMRAQFVRILGGLGISRDVVAIQDAHAIYVLLNSIEIAIDDLRPRNMRGFGEVPPELAQELDGIADGLQALAVKFTRFVQQCEEPEKSHGGPKREPAGG